MRTMQVTQAKRTPGELTVYLVESPKMGARLGVWSICPLDAKSYSPAQAEAVVATLAARGVKAVAQ